MHAGRSKDVALKLLLFISSLSAGGAERVMATLANEWVADHDVTLVTLDSPDTDFYVLDRKVDRIALDALRPSRSVCESIFANLPRLRQLRRAVRSTDPDVVVSFIDKMNVLAILAVVGMRLPVVISERTDPAMHDIGWFAALLRRLVYPRASAVVAQTASAANWLSGLVSERRIHVIANPVFEPTSFAVDVPLPNSAFIAALGRLVPVKGFDLLIEACARARIAEVGWHLVIVGEGQERHRLESLIRERGLADSVHLVGRSRTPSGIFRAAEFFVLSSRYEGFPNALVEAMACGVPAIALDCSGGPRTIVRDGVDGLLVPSGDVDALARAIRLLVDDPALRASMAANAADVIKRFSGREVLAKWDRVFAALSTGVRDGSAEARAQSFLEET